MLPSINLATLAAAASVLGQAIPAYADPKRLWATLRLADQANDNGSASQ